MPFAIKFRAMMDMPVAGDHLGSMTVESITVGHEGGAVGYAYPLRLVLCGAGGLAGVRKAIKPLFSQRSTTFSGYGTPYHLWFGKPTIESLGEGRYAVTADGAGVHVHLEADLKRFCEHLADEGLLPGTPEEQAALVTRYLDGYRAEVASLVGKYRRKIARVEGPEEGKSTGE
ncbi:MAG: hypothetical protein ACYCZF_17845 [Anaerolineae bacterium]